MTSRWRKYIVISCAGFLALCAAAFVHSQTSNNVANLRTQLRGRYDIVPLEGGVGLVPHQREGNIRLIEIRNGAVAINGNTVSAREARQQLGKDADLILRVTYLDAAAQRELAGADSSATASQANTEEAANERDGTSPERGQSHHGDIVRFGGTVSVGRNEVVDGDVVVMGGAADIDGEVTRDVTVIGGALNLGPEAIVRGDASVIGGSLNRSPGARIEGKINDVGFAGQFPANARIRRELPYWAPWVRFGGLGGTLLRVTLLILSTLIVVALGGRFVEAIADRAGTEPLRSGLAGLLAELLFVPMVVVTVVVLAVSIIGIPLLILVPFAIVLAVIPMLVGFTGVACQLGRFAGNRLGIKQGPYTQVAVGVLLIVAITLIARLIALAGGFVLGVAIGGSLSAVGGLAEYIAWTVGIGAVILTWLSTRRRGMPTAALPGPTAGEAPAH